jgi:membrane protease YdiL (CAAX protease family)
MIRRARLNFTIFTLAVAGSGWLGVAVDRAAGVETATGTATSSGGGTTGMLFFLLGPVAAALILHAFTRGRDGGGSLGLTPRAGIRWYAATAAFYPIVTAISIGLGVVTGFVTVNDRPGLLAAFGAVFLVQLIKNPIEEFVFRGYGTRTGSIWPGVLMHSVCNAIATPLMIDGYLTFDGNSDVMFSPVAGSIVLIVLTAGAGLALVYARKPAAVRPPAPLESVS